MGESGRAALPLGSLDEPAFHAPWQARLFALTVALQDRGVFTASEWSAALATAREVHRDTGPPHGSGEQADRHFRAWARALAALLDARGLAAEAEIDALRSAWQTAAERTPHGQPIEIERHDRAAGGSARLDEE